MISLARSDEQAYPRQKNVKMIVHRSVPKEKRDENSRNGKKIELSDRVSYIKWCEVCGSPFETVEPKRITCAGCQAKMLGWNLEKSEIDKVFTEMSDEAKALIEKEERETKNRKRRKRS